MCSDVAIQVVGVNKYYEMYDKPIDRLKQSLWRGRKQFYKTFSALTDVSFEVKRGETVGIVGRNGAGKSTLLQLICGTLAPSTGEIKVNGRVAALLELGAGFNPEFTGRENVFMSAAILGLSQMEIESRFDEIADFADIGEFIEHPVKTYSSGMYVRLAFAVIAHVDADILVIDEALSVGDAIFTQKCMRYIRSFQKKGTLLFVSHDMSSVLNLCKSAVWLDGGRIRQVSSSKNIADAYLKDSLQEVYNDEATLEDIQKSDNPIVSSSPKTSDEVAQVSVKNNLCNASGWSTGVAEVIEVSLERVDSDGGAAFAGGEKVIMTIKAVAHEALDKPILGFVVKDRLGQDLFGENSLSCTDDVNFSINAGVEFLGKFVFNLPFLPNGQYVVLASVANGELYNHVQHHYLHDALIINVVSNKVRWGLMGIPFDNISLSKCK